MGENVSWLFREDIRLHTAIKLSSVYLDLWQMQKKGVGERQVEN